MCIICAKKYSKDFSEDVAKKRARYLRKREQVLEQKKEYYKKNREEIRAKQSEYVSKNREKLLLANRQWRKNNPEKARANDVKNRYNRYQAIPPWLTDEQQREINAIYRKCKMITRETGIKHHVDHIIPINGRNVCGLHIPDNLQILTASENCSKKNSFEAGELTIQPAE